MPAESRVKFVNNPTAGFVSGVADAKRTPMGLAALKVNPSIALKPRMAANCQISRRSSGLAGAGSAFSGAETGADTGAAVAATG